MAQQYGFSTGYDGMFASGAGSAFPGPLFSEGTAQQAKLHATSVRYFLSQLRQGRSARSIINTIVAALATSFKPDSEAGRWFAALCDVSAQVVDPLAPRPLAPLVAYYLWEALDRLLSSLVADMVPAAAAQYRSDIVHLLSILGPEDLDRAPMLVGDEVHEAHVRWHAANPAAPGLAAERAAAAAQAAAADANYTAENFSSRGKRLQFLPDPATAAAGRLRIAQQLANIRASLDPHWRSTIAFLAASAQRLAPESEFPSFALFWEAAFLAQFGQPGPAEVALLKGCFPLSGETWSAWVSRLRAAVLANAPKPFLDEQQLLDHFFVLLAHQQFDVNLNALADSLYNALPDPRTLEQLLTLLSKHMKDKQAQANHASTLMPLRRQLSAAPRSQSPAPRAQSPAPQGTLSMSGRTNHPRSTSPAPPRRNVTFSANPSSAADPLLHYSNAADLAADSARHLRRDSRSPNSSLRATTVTPGAFCTVCQEPHLNGYCYPQSAGSTIVPLHWRPKLGPQWEAWQKDCVQKGVIDPRPPSPTRPLPRPGHSSTPGGRPIPHRPSATSNRPRAAAVVATTASTPNYNRAPPPSAQQQHAARFTSYNDDYTPTYQDEEEYSFGANMADADQPAAWPMRLRSSSRQQPEPQLQSSEDEQSDDDDDNDEPPALMPEGPAPPLLARPPPPPPPRRPAVMGRNPGPVPFTVTPLPPGTSPEQLPLPQSPRIVRRAPVLVHQQPQAAAPQLGQGVQLAAVARQGRPMEVEVPLSRLLDWAAGGSQDVLRPFLTRGAPLIISGVGPELYAVPVGNVSLLVPGAQWQELQAAQLAAQGGGQGGEGGAAAHVAAAGQGWEGQGQAAGRGSSGNSGCEGMPALMPFTPAQRAAWQEHERLKAQRWDAEVNRLAAEGIRVRGQRLDFRQLNAAAMPLGQPGVAAAEVAEGWEVLRGLEGELEGGGGLEGELEGGGELEGELEGGVGGAPPSGEDSDVFSDDLEAQPLDELQGRAARAPTAVTLASQLGRLERGLELRLDEQVEQLRRVHGLQLHQPVEAPDAAAAALQPLMELQQRLDELEVLPPQQRASRLLDGCTSDPDANDEYHAELLEMGGQHFWESNHSWAAEPGVKLDAAAHSAQSGVGAPPSSPQLTQRIYDVPAVACLPANQPHAGISLFVDGQFKASPCTMTDSGANVNLMTLDLAQHLGVQYAPDDTVALHSTAPSPCPTLGKVSSKVVIHLALGTPGAIDFCLPIHIISTSKPQSWGLLLGTGWLAAVGACLDFYTSQLHYRPRLKDVTAGTSTPDSDPRLQVFSIPLITTTSNPSPAFLADLLSPAGILYADDTVEATIAINPAKSAPLSLSSCSFLGRATPRMPPRRPQTPLSDEDEEPETWGPSARRPAAAAPLPAAAAPLPAAPAPLPAAAVQPPAPPSPTYIPTAPTWDDAESPPTSPQPQQYPHPFPNYYIYDNYQPPGDDHLPQLALPPEVEAADLLPSSLDYPGLWPGQRDIHLRRRAGPYPGDNGRIFHPPSSDLHAPSWEYDGLSILELPDQSCLIAHTINSSCGQPLALSVCEALGRAGVVAFWQTTHPQELYHWPEDEPPYGHRRRRRVRIKADCYDLDRLLHQLSGSLRAILPFTIDVTHIPPASQRARRRGQYEAWLLARSDLGAFGRWMHGMGWDERVIYAASPASELLLPGPKPHSEAGAVPSAIIAGQQQQPDVSLPVTAATTPISPMAAASSSPIPTPSPPLAPNPSPPAAVSGIISDSSSGGGPPPGYDHMQAYMPHGTVDPDPKGNCVKSPHGWRIGLHPEMTPAQFTRLEEGLVARKQRSFAATLDSLRGYTGMDGGLEIPLRHDKPIFQTARRYTPAEEAIRDTKCQELLDAALIERAAPTCQYAARPTMPAKRDPDGNWTDHRFCIDYRRLNDATIPDRYGLHLADEVLQQVARCRYWSRVDARQAFMQVPIVEADRPKTAFWWKNELWQFKFMPYGLVSGSAKCQRIMDVELAAAGLSGPEGVCSFVDDAVAASTAGGIDGHIDLVFKLLDALAAVNILLHPAKCCFLIPDGLSVLGHSITPAGVAPQESKVASIRALASPTTLKELRSKIAFLNYYRCYIPHFSAIAAPINELLRKGVPWCWGPKQEQAFTRLKDIVCTPGVVLRPFDPVLPARLYTDWCNVGIAAVLHQLCEDGKEYLVSCMSRSLNPHERNASSYEGECLAAVWGVRAHRQQLHGVPFTLVTDHQPLKWLMANQELTGKHMRWALVLQEYTFIVEHRAGSAHANVDVLSRYPLPEWFDSTGACLDPVAASPATALAASPFPFCLLDEPSFSSHSTAIDSFAPSAQDLLHLPPSWVGEGCPPWAAREAAGLAAVASRWVSAAWDELPKDWRGQPLVLGGPGAVDVHGVRPALQLCTHPVGAELRLASQGRCGIVLYEPFGGLCAGLDMALACGMRVAQYYYSDTDPAAVAVARARVAEFHNLYPHLFGPLASDGAFSTLPMDVRQVSTASLIKAGAQCEMQWLVVAGWSCEDLSPAGKGQGLEGSRSSNFFDAVRIVGALQQLQKGRPPAYIMENTAMQASFAHDAVRELDFPRICGILGDPVLLDAAQVGSYGHRLRNYWSNIMPAPLVSAVLAQAHRAPGRLVDSVLDPGRRTRPVQRVQGGEFYQCNERGQPPCALPTLVAFPGSRAYSNGQQGMLVVESTGELVEPNPDERERILGYPTGCTKVQGVSQRQRHVITGRAMDRHAMVHLMAVMLQLADCQQELVPPPWGTQQWEPPQLAWPYSEQAVGIMQAHGWQWGQPLLAPSAREPIVEPISIVGNVGTRGLGFEGMWAGYGHGPGGQWLWEDDLWMEQATAKLEQLNLRFSACSTVSSGEPGCSHSSHSAVYSEADVHEHYCGLSELAAQQEGDEKASGSRADPHSDAGLLFFLQHGKLPQGTEQKDSARIRRRAGRYGLVDGKLQRVMGDGSKRLVPAPEQRVDIVRATHERTGHFGIKRTKHMLLASFWWPGLEADVVKVLAACEPCARIKASFNAERPQLQPLPIEGLFYRWGVDMAGPFAKSADGNLYVVIMIEHLSKQIELVAVRDKTARGNAYAFLSTVLARYGACAEVLTDRGGEFHGEFHQLLVECLIDHRTTSPNHPQADGLAERAVQTIKKALAKHVAQHQQLGDWDWELHWVALGYRTSKQAATGLSPYEMLYGVQPIIPPAIRERVEDPVLDFSDSDQAAEYVVQRAQLHKRHCAVAMSNLRIAQHRDTLRYQQVRSGMYMPVTVKFEPGDFVHVRRRTVVNSLQSEARPGVYRVVALLPTGVVELMGRCGRTTKVNIAECAPCHLVNINPVLDPALQRVEEDFPCAVCGSPDDGAVMVLCDGCFKGYHIYCMQPPLAAVPEEDIWLCSDCKLQGMDEHAVSVLRQLNMPVAESDAPLFPSVQQRAHDAEAQQLQGKAAWLPGARAGEPWVRGVLEYVPRVERKGHSRSPLRWVAAGKQPVYLSLRKADRLVKAGKPHAAGEGEEESTAMLSDALASVFVSQGAGNVRGAMLGKLSVLEDKQQVAQALREWCKAVVSEKQAEACLAAVQQLAQQGEGGELGFTADQVWVLVRAVDLRVCDKLAVAGGAAAVLAAVLRERYSKALWAFNKEPGWGLDQVSPGWYRKAQVRKPLDWVFLHPPKGLVCLALGLAAQQARKGLAMLVPRSVLTNAGKLLQSMLQQFEEQQRLVCITSSCDEMAWVVVFASSQLEQLMVSLRGKVHSTEWVLAGLR